jgi:hypothetical protein
VLKSIPLVCNFNVCRRTFDTSASVVDELIDRPLGRLVVRAWRRERSERRTHLGKRQPEQTVILAG